MNITKRTLTVIGLTMILASYQNCGQPGSVTVTDGDLESRLQDLSTDPDSITAEASNVEGGPVTDLDMDSGTHPSADSRSTASSPGTSPIPPISSSPSTPTPSTLPVPPQQPPPQPPVKNYVLQTVALPAVVKENGSSRIEVNYSNLSRISYSCRDNATAGVLLEGSNTPEKTEGIWTLNIGSISSDMTCKFAGETGGMGQDQVIKNTVSIELNCMNRIKNQAGRCEDFRCLKFVELTDSALARIPARTSEGICYTKKLMSRIANSKSSLSPNRDPEVLSKDHDKNSTSSSPNHPYILGASKSEVTLEGERVVKLSGGQSATMNILVDNFLLLGTFPATVNVTTENTSKYYKVRGTSDSAYSATTGIGVQFRSTLLPVSPFGTGGTSSIAPIDISAEIEPGTPHTLDIRALDCGGARELSDVYLLFQ
jgi:hypothetical protein